VDEGRILLIHAVAFFSWVSRISKDAYKIAIDTKGDGRPDIVKTYKDNAVVQIESDRNFDRPD
jgi:hypothetical protein